MDIRIFSNTSIYSKTDPLTELMVSAPLESAAATRLETIAGKVVRFLLTSRGSDALEPSYGSYLPTYTQIAEASLPRMQMDLLNDLRRCQAYICAAEKTLPAGEEKLRTVSLQKLQYAPGGDRGRIDIFVEITTTADNSSLLSVPLKLS